MAKKTPKETTLGARVSDPQSGEAGLRPAQSEEGTKEQTAPPPETPPVQGTPPVARTSESAPLGARVSDPPAPQAPKPSPKDTPSPPAKVRVRVISKRPVYENGIKAPGAEFETTPARAAQLGALVQII